MRAKGSVWSGSLLSLKKQRDKPSIADIHLIPAFEEFSTLLASRDVRLSMLDDVEREAKAALEQLHARNTVLAKRLGRAKH